MIEYWNVKDPVDSGVGPNLCHSFFQSIPTNRRRETDLLVCCARTHLDPETTERIHSLSQKGIDWEYLLGLASRHRVMPLLCRSLEKACAQVIPGMILEQLRTYFTFNTRRNLVFSGKLIKLLNLLNENRISAVPFKGPALAEFVYGDLSLRQFCDLDILVHGRDAFRARNLLISHGYRPETQLNDSQYKVFVKLKNSAPFISNDGKIAVDLHWEMTGRYSLLHFDLENLKDRIVPATLAGKSISHLCPEDLLLYLCHHGSLHCWQYLEMICSVAELIRSYTDMDWLQVANLAAGLRCERILLLGLFLAHDLLGAPLPARVLAMLKDDARIPKLAGGIYKNLFFDQEDSVENGINPKFSSFHIKVRERLSEKIRYGLHLAVNPTKQEWELASLPASLAFFHYLFRPIRLATGLGAVLLRRCLSILSVIFLHFMPKHFRHQVTKTQRFTEDR
jgi:hypothetical protein